MGAKVWPVVYPVVLVGASVRLKPLTWQLPHSPGFAVGLAWVAPIVLSHVNPEGCQPAVPSTIGPCGECGPRYVVRSGSPRLWWQVMHRLLSSSASVESRRSALLSLPCGSWQVAQVVGTQSAGAVPLACSVNLAS